MLSRKRQRPNPATADPSGSTLAGPVGANTSHMASASQSAINPQGTSPATENGTSTPVSAPGAPRQLHKARSWYGSRTGPTKAAASTLVAKENIFGGTVKSTKQSNLSKFEIRRPSDTASVVDGPATSSSLQEGSRAELPSSEISNNTAASSAQKPETTSETVDSSRSSTPVTPTRPSTSSAWLGWLSKTPFTETQAVPQQPLASSPDTQPQPNSPSATMERTQPQDTPIRIEQAAPTPWFTFWGTPAPSVASQSSEQDKTNEVVDKANKKAGETEPAPVATQKEVVTPKAGSTWAFWSKATSSTGGQRPGSSAGEIAVMGEGSEAHPKPMDEGTMSPPARKGKNMAEPKAIDAKQSTWRRNKRTRPASMDIESGSPRSATSADMSAEQSKAAIGTQMTTPSQAPKGTPPVSNESSDKTIVVSDAVANKTANLLMPSFTNTYQMKENHSILKQITSLLLRTQSQPTSHVFRIKEPPKIRKALTIGIHGLFPATYLRPMIGQPTGTSLRFATLGADAVRKWADAHGCGDCEIEKVALEGEGKISERVDSLWKLLLNWIEQIRKADLILIACHSQGVPVSVMLLEKLIDLGIITEAKIGVCAMAGVALGPFPEYKSNFLMGSASELWEFGDPKSQNSLRFESAMKRVLDYGVRITFIGSIDDQVVPMESAVYSPANHPYIYRAVFIDGRIHAPDFIAHLVGFALKLRNLGISDHGLIRELSIPLAGSLYSGEGHSRLYYEPAVYDLAVTHALETTSVPKSAPAAFHTREPLSAANPYVLPWIMRGLLEEDFVKTELSEETEELLRQFDDWKPSNKALKDVKYRLEAVRMRTK